MLNPARLAAAATVACVAGVASAAQLELPEMPDFFSWKKMHNKVYDSELEEFQRYKLFKKKYAQVEAHNANADLYGWTKGLNQFSDMTDDEITHMLMPVTGEYMEVFNNATHVTGPTPGLTDVNWVAQGKVGPVKSQGGCGSCWIFAATGAIEGAYAIKHNNLLSFSEQQSLSCLTNGCEGGWPSYVYDYAKTRPLDQESAWPYTEAKGECKTVDGVVRVSGYRGFPGQGFYNGLASGPMSVIVNVCQGFMEYHGGVYSEPCSDQERRGMHAIVAVASDGGSVTIKNSWGTGWGENGFMRAVHDSNMNGGVQNSGQLPFVY